MSTLKVGTIQNTSGVEVYTCKAWVNFNGTGTVAIRASGNVSSITDDGVGKYTINFTNAMADANYSLIGTGGFRDATDNVEPNSISIRRLNTAPYSTTQCAISTSFTGATGGTDLQYVNVAIFR
jgi:hypothetical protein